MSVRAVVWGENVHDRENHLVRRIYPDGMQSYIADALNIDPTISATTATLEQVDHGLSEERLADTDVLFWWGHAAHGSVDDAVVDRVIERVWQGMGLVVLHSGFWPLFKGFSQADGNTVLTFVARGGREGARLGGQWQSPHRTRRGTIL